MASQFSCEPERLSVITEDTTMAGTPGMKVTPSSTIQELQTWQKMYENPFFNPGRRITEEDIQNALPPSSTYHDIVSGPRPSGIPKVPNAAKSRKLKTNQAYHTLCTRNHFKNLPLPKRKATEDNEDEENRPPPGPSQTPGGSRLGTPASDTRPSTRQGTPTTSRPLARRPRHSVVGASFVASTLATKPSSPAAEEAPSPLPGTPPAISPEPLPSTERKEKQCDMQAPSDPSLEVWIEHSFTTVCKHDDPTDPDSYYNTHYPLLLNKIPRRKKKADSMCNLQDLAVNRPEIDMSFYEQVPLRRLSSPTLSRLNAAASDTVIEATSESKLSSTL